MISMVAGALCVNVYHEWLFSLLKWCFCIHICGNRCADIKNVGVLEKKRIMTCW